MEEMHWTSEGYLYVLRLLNHGTTKGSKCTQICFFQQLNAWTNVANWGLRFPVYINKNRSLASTLRLQCTLRSSSPAELQEGGIFPPSHLCGPMWSLSLAFISCLWHFAEIGGTCKEPRLVKLNAVTSCWLTCGTQSLETEVLGVMLFYLRSHFGTDSVI